MSFGAMPGGPGMPPMLGMGMNPSMPGLERDPSIDLARLGHAMQSQPTYRRYPRWFKKPPEPSDTGVYEAGIKLYDEMSDWRKAVRHDLLLLRMMESGVFRNDEQDVLNLAMEQYQSPGLVDEFNLAVSWISGLEQRIHKDPMSDELRTMTRQVKLAAEWMRRVEALCHTDKLEMNRGTLEPKVLLSYGRLVKRRTLNKDAEPYYSPFHVDYIDPAQIRAISDGYGVKTLFRVYSSKVRDLADAYGDFSDGSWKKIKDKFGNDLTDESEVHNIVEYWDRWYRCVNIMGVPVLKVTEHMYGDVPFTIGLGPLGEPSMTSLPDPAGATSGGEQTYRENLMHKSVGYVRFRKHSHILREAVMTRALYGMEQDFFPAIVRYRSAQAAMKPAPRLNGGPLAQNVAILGEEKIEPFPRNTQSLSSHQHVIQNMEKDALTGSAPVSAYGHMDKSNISGVANQQAYAAGLHLWRPWVQHLESFGAADSALAFKLWARWGHTVEYAYPEPRPFVVPIGNPQQGEKGSFRLESNTIYRVGPDIRIVMSAEDKDQWLLRAQTFAAMHELGFNREFLSQELFNKDYDARMHEDWQEEQSFQRMMDNPKFLEIVGIPTYLVKQIQDFEGDAETQEMLVDFLDKWEKIMVEPAMLQHQADMLQLQQALAAPTPGEAVPLGGEAPAPSGGPTGGGPPPGGGLPPTTAGVSLPSFGQGPGSVTGSQSPGRPPGGSQQGGY